MVSWADYTQHAIARKLYINSISRALENAAQGAAYLHAKAPLFLILPVLIDRDNWHLKFTQSLYMAGAE